MQVSARCRDLLALTFLAQMLGCSASGTDALPSPGGSLRGGVAGNAGQAPGASSPPAGAGGGLALTPNATPQDPNAQPNEPSEVCAAETSQAEVTKRPMDIILVVDNSGSMTKEIAAVEANINRNFAQILEASGIDYRVILFSLYSLGPEAAGSRGLGVCIGDPLGPGACSGRATSVSPHGPRFFHFRDEVSSHDAWCRLHDMADAPLTTGDPVVKGGWLSLLRPGSFKSFLMIGDDTMKIRAGLAGFLCSSADPILAAPAVAQKFDDWLLAHSPAQFGTKEHRNYTWHSIVGVGEKPDPKVPYEAAEPIVSKTCDTAQNPGEPHQYLSVMTGGLRFPVCYLPSYDSVFKRIAASVIERAQLPCSWKVPAAPPGEQFDPGLLNLEYLPSGSASAVELVNVDSQADCGATDAWYYDDPKAPTQVFACPNTCSKLEQDATGRVDVKLGCSTLRPVK